MASDDDCDPCFSKEKYTVAVKLCINCHEKLCEECADNHLGFKAFKSHHLAQIPFIPTSIPTFEKYCIIHKNMNLDFYCSRHDTSCCRECIPSSHQTCPEIVTLEVACKDVQNSPLLTETLNELNNIVKTLQTLSKFTQDSISSLDSSVASILGEIMSIKKRLVKQLDDLEQELSQKVSTKKEYLKMELKKTEKDISHKMKEIYETQQELKFLKEHNMNKKLFLALHEYEKEAKNSEKDITDIITTCKVTDINYEQTTQNIESLGTITETTRPCDVRYTPTKYKQAQTHSDVTLKRDSDITMKQPENYRLTGLAITKDNKLLLCNYKLHYQRVYIYSDSNHFEDQLLFSSRPFSIAVIPDTRKAVVTLPEENSIQFINTGVLAKKNKIKLSFEPWGVTATTTSVVVGGYDEVHLFDINGSFQRKIDIPEIGYIHFVSLNNQNTEVISRGDGELYCNDLDGNVLYQYKISGEGGLAVDRQGDVYVADCHTDKLYRLSSDGKISDTILTNEVGIRNPYAMAFNNDSNKLYIICNSNTTVTCFPYISLC